MPHFLNKPKTYFLLIVLIPVIAIGLLFIKYYPLYKSAKSALDPSLSNSSQSNVIIKNPFDDFNDFDAIDDKDVEDKDIIEDTDTKVVSSIKDENKIENDKNLISDDLIVESKNNPSTESKKTITNKEPNSFKNENQPSYNKIVASYKVKFEKLQTKQENNLYSLMEKGKAEYAANKDSKSSLVNLASKYLNTINNMEKQSDKEFNELINGLKSELTSNSYNTGIVKEIRDYYDYYKNSLKSELIQKATQQM